MSKPKFIVAEATYQLPEALETEIGRIVLRYSFLEDVLRMTIWAFLEVDHSIGRVATREPDLKACAEAIRDLATMREFPLPDDWKKLVERAHKLGEKRNLIVHGAWLPPQDGTIYVQDTRGSCRPEPRLPKISKKAEPSAISVTYEGLRGIRREMESIISRFSELHLAVAARFSASP